MIVPTVGRCVFLVALAISLLWIGSDAAFIRGGGGRQSQRNLQSCVTAGSKSKFCGSNAGPNKPCCPGLICASNGECAAPPPPPSPSPTVSPSSPPSPSPTGSPSSVPSRTPTRSPSLTDFPTLSPNNCGNGVCDADENIFTCPADECAFECGVTTSCSTLSSANGNVASSGGVGLFFNVKALKDLAITKLKVRAYEAGACAVRIYHRSGSFVGFQSTTQGWTKVLDSTAACQGNSLFTDLPDFTSVVTIDGGSTHSFHVYTTANSGQAWLNTTGTPVEGLSSVYNSDIELYAGEAYCDELPTSCSFQGLTTGQVWNGEVTYGLEESLTSSPTTTVSLVHLTYCLTR